MPLSFCECIKRLVFVYRLRLVGVFFQPRGNHHSGDVLVDEIDFGGEIRHMSVKPKSTVRQCVFTDT